MLPKDHIIYSIIFSALVYIFWHSISLAEAILIIVSAILIDIDHYAVYVLRKKDLSLKNAVDYCVELGKKLKIDKRKKIKAPLHIFHTLEFISLIFILSLFSNLFLFILVGLLFHSLLDVIYMYKKEYIERREYSIILWLFRRKRKDWKYY